MLLTRPQYEASAAALRSLALAGNALTDQHVGMLLEGLQGLLQIERVDLSLNRLTRVAAGALARTIVEGQAKHVRLTSRPRAMLCTLVYDQTCRELATYLHSETTLLRWAGAVWRIRVG